MKLLVTMGYHNRETSDHWRYDTAAVTLIDWDKKQILRELTYVSPPEQQAMEGHMLFACGQMLGKKLLVTTHTEVVTIDLEAWKVERVFSSRHFNDLHHALQIDRDIFVCNTGLQTVQRMSQAGEVLETISTQAGSTWDFYQPELDYRKTTTKPHPVHPNHLFEYGGELWVTRANLRDAVQVRDHSRKMVIEAGTPHDGLVEGDWIYFTTTNGHIVVVDGKTGRQIRDIDLNALDNRHQQLGWCRGIHLVPDEKILVGFGQFRRTKYKQFAHWILNDGNAALPSRLALYDLREPKLLDEMHFTGKYEGLAIYSIFLWPE